jgi:hypothetical protein
MAAALRRNRRQVAAVGGGVGQSVPSSVSGAGLYSVDDLGVGMVVGGGGEAAVGGGAEDAGGASERRGVGVGVLPEVEVGGGRRRPGSEPASLGSRRWAAFGGENIGIVSANGRGREGREGERGERGDHLQVLRVRLRDKEAQDRERRRKEQDAERMQDIVLGGSGVGPAVAAAAADGLGLRRRWAGSRVAVDQSGARDSKQARQARHVLVGRRHRHVGGQLRPLNLPTVQGSTASGGLPGGLYETSLS